MSALSARSGRTQDLRTQAAVPHIQHLSAEVIGFSCLEPFDERFSLQTHGRAIANHHNRNETHLPPVPLQQIHSNVPKGIAALLGIGGLRSTCKFAGTIRWPDAPALQRSWASCWGLRSLPRRRAAHSPRPELPAGDAYKQVRRRSPTNANTGNIPNAACARLRIGNHRAPDARPTSARHSQGAARVAALPFASRVFCI
jgi:hypothetical protein